MILFISLLLLALTMLTIFIVLAGSGTMLIAILFGDVIVFIWIMIGICKHLFKKK